MDLPNVNTEKEQLLIYDRDCVDLRDNMYKPSLSMLPAPMLFNKKRIGYTLIPYMKLRTRHQTDTGRCVSIALTALIDTVGSNSVSKPRISARSTRLKAKERKGLMIEKLDSMQEHTANIRTTHASIIQKQSVYPLINT